MKKKTFGILILILILILIRIILAVYEVLLKDPYVSERIERDRAENKTWFLDYKVISHAFGGIDGIDYTNSYEALEESYANHQRVVEVDFRFTSDGTLVCRHDWTEDLGQEEIDGSVPSLEVFQSALIYGKYTPVTAEDLIEYMSEHEDLYVVTDVKHKMKSTTFEESMKEFVKLAEKIDASVLKRTIVQIYCEEDYDKMEKIYPFYSYIFTLYKLPSEYKDSYDKVADFCVDKNIPVVTMPAKWVTERADIEPLLDKDIKVYVHTVNDYNQAAELLEWGVNGIYSDYLYENDLENINAN